METNDKQTGQGSRQVYRTCAVLLDEEVLKHSKVRGANPERMPGMPCVYVGSTCKSAEERYADHKRGHGASWWARQCGRMLLPDDLVPTGTWPTRAEAEAAEKRLARELRSLGWAVWFN